MKSAASEKNWQSIAEIMGYKDKKSMLQDLYVNKNLSSRVVGDLIGYCGDAVLFQLKQEGIPLKPPGGANHVKLARD